MKTQMIYDWDALAALIQKLNGPVFVVTGKTSFGLSGAKDRILQCVGSSDMIFFDDFTPNPQLRDIQKGVKIFQKHKPALLVSVGGGSTIDVAKSILFLADVDEENHIAALSSAKEFEQSRYIKHVAIPTTFGTGSEATSFATVYVNAKKYSLSASSCLPDGALLDVSLGQSASPYIKASCGIDALCQAIESFWARGATEESRQFAREAISALLPNLRSFVAGNVSKDVLNGSNLAGKAINISKTTAPHAISYGITQKFGVEHGQAVFLTLPYFIIKNAISDETGVMSDLVECLGEKSAQDAATSLIQLAQDIGLKTRLSEIADVKRSDAEKLARDVNLERLGNHPYPVEFDDIVEALMG